MGRGLGLAFQRQVYCMTDFKVRYCAEPEDEEPRVFTLVVNAPDRPTAPAIADQVGAQAVMASGRALGPKDVDYEIVD
jgi:hypothetical protein